MGDVDVIEQVFDEDVAHALPLNAYAPGRDGIEAYALSLRSAFPNIRITPILLPEIPPGGRNLFRVGYEVAGGVLPLCCESCGHECTSAELRWDIVQIENGQIQLIFGDIERQAATLAGNSTDV